MPISYAGPGDYIAYVGGETPPTDVSRRLARASDLVRYYTQLANWETDTNGYAVDTAVREALRDATCAQAHYGVVTGTQGGTSGSWGSVKIGSVSLSDGGAGTTTSAGRERLCDEAHMILRNANLLNAY